MRSSRLVGPVAALALAVGVGGCASPYRADQGAFYGGLGGAGLGALAGSAVDAPLAGAAIGGVVGALSGAAIGGSLDEVEARNRAEIAARMGRPAPVGAVTVPDVLSMSQAGVTEDVIITHIRCHGVAQVLTSNDLILLQQQGVSPRVIQAMQMPPTPQPVVVQQAPPPPPAVIVQEHYIRDPWYYGPPPPPWYGPPPCRYRPHRHHHHGPRVGFGIAISN